MDYVSFLVYKIVLCFQCMYGFSDHGPPLSLLFQVVNELGGAWLVTSDHGNADDMVQRTLSFTR